MIIGGAQGEGREKEERSALLNKAWTQEKLVYWNLSYWGLITAQPVGEGKYLQPTLDIVFPLKHGGGGLRGACGAHIPGTQAH